MTGYPVVTGTTQSEASTEGDIPDITLNSIDDVFNLAMAGVAQADFQSISLFAVMTNRVEVM
jgi:hypothetical protein